MTVIMGMCCCSRFDAFFIDLFFYEFFNSSSSNTTPNSLEDSSISINFTVLSNEGGMKRVATSPISNSSNSSSRGQSKKVQDRSQRNGNRTTNETIKTTMSNAYDMMRAAGNGDIDGLRDSTSSNSNSTKNSFR